MRGVGLADGKRRLGSPMQIVVVGRDNDYRLAAGSPLIDAGDNAGAALDLLDIDDDTDTLERVPLDLALFPRFVDDPATTDTGSGSAPLIDMGCHEFQP